MPIVYYRTRDGREDYKFSFERQTNSTWRTYILRQPGYGTRSSGAHITHRLSDGGRKYICWDTPLRSLAEAKQLAAAWADKTQDYIKYGRRF